MDNDYLWNKKGEDQEIELLEKQLQIFQYRELKPPDLPVIVSGSKPYFSFFSLKFAFSLSILCVLLLDGGAQLIKSDLNDEAKISKSDLLAQNISLITFKAVKNESESDRVIVPLKTSSTPKPQFVNSTFRVKKHFPSPKPKAKTKVRLTSEEKYAFDQLMLALSITGSKLKEVKSKVNGGGEIPNEINSIR